ncbi:hypothetical protein KCU81_g8901, partial [Aureobasidium melanogenum]|uniref:BZIP domain-containing protein n=1 Tax=Aureobasidium melanogenum (strain CBS 110374) TaxID=1043003 RepID=A0A074VQ01_AURM1
MSTLASAQPSSVYPATTQDGPHVALFRAAGDGAPPQLKRSIGSIDSTMDAHSPISAASPDDAPPGKIAIPALKRPRNDSTVNNGPLSRDVVLKPRPKPGRKPMADQNDSSDKRKTQNRMAQRNFRDRRAQKCNDLEIENAQLKANFESERSAWMEQLRQRDAENARLSAQLADGNAKSAQIDLENRQLRERIAEMQRELGICPIAYCPVEAIMLTLAQRSVTSNLVSSVHHILTPPSDNDAHDEYEVDFTNIYASRKPSAFTSGLGTDEHCGFCSDVENCICRQQEELNNKSLPSLPPIDSSRAITQPKLPSDVSAPSFLEARTEASGPGTCDMCLADPEKARQCRELAEVAFKDKEAAASRSDDSGSKDMGTVTLRRLQQLDSTKPRERTSCSDFFQQAQQRNVRFRRDDYQQIKHVYRLDGRSQHSPYMEMDTQDAAHALAALSRQDTRSGLDRQS